MKTKKTTKKEVHCLHCYDDGAREQAVVFDSFNEVVPDYIEAVSDYHSWNKIGKVDINYCAIILGVMLLGIVVAMITTNYGYGFINA